MFFGHRGQVRSDGGRLKKDKLEHQDEIQMESRTGKGRGRHGESATTKERASQARERMAGAILAHMSWPPGAANKFQQRASEEEPLPPLVGLGLSVSCGFCREDCAPCANMFLASFRLQNYDLGTSIEYVEAIANPCSKVPALPLQWTEA